MMRLWFAAQSEVPIYRQLVTQVVLAILSGELRAGERLTSTRALARRFKIHPNTVSAGYKQLEEEGWVESRRGSGVYVRAGEPELTTPEQVLEYHISGFFRAMRSSGLDQALVRARVARWLQAPPPDHFLLIDPDARMREILLTELRGVAAMPVRETTPEACCTRAMLTGAVALCRPSKTQMVREALPAGVELVTLPINSATAWLQPWVTKWLATGRAVKNGKLIAVVSHWPEFLAIARTMLLAAGLPDEAMMLREAGVGEWRRGLEQASAVLCDSYTATLKLPVKAKDVVVFPVLARSVREVLGKV
jgi:DNA-binding transcriptional regulator YhcF (GntR family)